tara:strand:+ start:386 stop:1126 length:741 start_codon:yes stop_codon:yes gene_type:complete
MKENEIFVHRIGNDPNSFMITEQIIGTVKKKKNYRVSFEGLLETQEKVSANQAITNPSVPRYIQIKGDWNPDATKEIHQANLLGGTGTLTISESKIEIPGNQATPELLSFYGATLFKIGDIFQFETNAELPVTTMNIGETYVEHYLKLPNLGGGTYIEYHDRPHFHLPLDRSASGHLILGHFKSNEYILSAFMIPFGYGIYTPPELLHADAYLIGRYMVVYSITEHFSTVLFKNKKNKLVDVTISK